MQVLPAALFIICQAGTCMGTATRYFAITAAKFNSAKRYVLSQEGDSDVPRKALKLALADSQLAMHVCVCVAQRACKMM